MIIPTTPEIDKELERRELQESLIAYAVWSFKQKTGKEFIVNEHHLKICRALERVFRGETRRLIINIPPRYSKTELAVKAFIEWCLAKVPDSKFIHLSYSDPLALDNSSSIRESIKSDWYQQHWPMKTKKDADSKAKWFTEYGGGVYATGIEGSITGFGAGRTGPGFGGALIIDDPIKPSDALSGETRKRINRRLNDTLISRLNNPQETPIILIMQRLHEEDMSGFCLAGGTGEAWEHLCLPALDENDEPLWPLKHTKEQLQAMRKADAQTFAGQYMQRPSPQQGIIFQRSWFPFYREMPPRFDQVVMGWDFAVKGKTTSDYTVGIVMGRIRADKYVLDIYRKKVNFPDACQALIQMCQRWPQAHKKIVEDKANGSPLVDTLKHQVPGLVLVNPTTDKVQRANAVAPECQSGNIYVPDPQIYPWVTDLLDELCVFPKGVHDDQVDAFCYALSDLMKGGSFFAPISGHGSGALY